MLFHIPQIKYSDVFVPGGLPTYTYNPRESRQLERLIQESTSNFKLLVVTGPTKSGKTVLVNKVFPRNENLWIDGGAIGKEENFWELIVSELGGYTEEQITNGEDMQFTIAGVTEAEGNILLAKVNAGLSGTAGTTEKTEYLQRRSMSNKAKAISLLQETKVPLIIDDFHYIPKSVQKLIVRALKAPIMYGVPVICISLQNEFGKKHTPKTLDVLTRLGYENCYFETDYVNKNIDSIKQKADELLNSDLKKSIQQKMDKEAESFNAFQRALLSIVEDKKQ